MASAGAARRRSEGQGGKAGAVRGSRAAAGRGTTAPPVAPTGVSEAFACVHCGGPLRRQRPARAGKRGHPLEIRCPSCRYKIYDYPRPCAGMLVLKGGDLLVLRRGHHPRRGYLDTPMQKAPLEWRR